MQPYDYTIKAENPADALMSGVGRGLQLSNLAAQRTQAEQQALALEEQRKQAQQMQADLANLASNKSASATDFTSMMVKYPTLSEHLKKSWDVLDENQKRSVTKQSLDVFSALNANMPDVAERIIQERITAAENSGDKDTADRSRTMLELIRVNPEAAKTSSALFLANTMGEDKFAEVFTKLQGERRAEETAPLERRKLESEILTTAENTRLRAMEAALRREDNALKREELGLKINELKNKVDVKAKERVAEASGAIDTFDRTISTLESILNNPALESATGMSSFLSLIPGTEAKDVSALIDMFQSQAFATELSKMKGLGALSETEGKALVAQVANLDRSQSTQAFRKNLENAYNMFKKGRDRVNKRYADVLNKPTEAQYGIEIGTVDSGYRYLGGDPASPQSWEKQ